MQQVSNGTSSGASLLAVHWHCLHRFASAITTSTACRMQEYGRSQECPVMPLISILTNSFGTMDSDSFGDKTNLINAVSDMTTRDGKG